MEIVRAGRRLDHWIGGSNSRGPGAGEGGRMMDGAGSGTYRPPREIRLAAARTYSRGVGGRRTFGELVAAPACASAPTRAGVVARPLRAGSVSDSSTARLERPLGDADDDEHESGADDELRIGDPIQRHRTVSLRSSARSAGGIVSSSMPRGLQLAGQVDGLVRGYQGRPRPNRSTGRTLTMALGRVCRPSPVVTLGRRIL